MEKLTFTVSEFGRLAGIGRNLAYEAVRTGQVRAVRIGKRLLIPKSEVRRLLGESEGFGNTGIGAASIDSSGTRCQSR